jgi:hypothetical protein
MRSDLSAMEEVQAIEDLLSGTEKRDRLRRGRRWLLLALALVPSVSDFVVAQRKRRPWRK